MKSQKDKLTAADYLFYYENKMIPMLFYSDDMDFFGAIAENPTSFYEIFRDACKSNGIRQDYTVNDFDVILSQPEDGWFALTLTFPPQLSEPIRLSPEARIVRSVPSLASDDPEPS